MRSPVCVPSSRSTLEPVYKLQGVQGVSASPAPTKTLLLTRDIQPDQLDAPASVMFVNVLLVPSLNRRCFLDSLFK